MHDTFLAHQNTIRNAARKYHRWTGIEYEELEAQGNLIFCLAFNDYKKCRRSFNSFLYERLDAGLSHYCNNRSWELSELCAAEELMSVSDTRQYNNSVSDGSFWDVVSDTSNDVQTIIDMIFSPHTSKRIRAHRQAKQHPWKKMPLTKHQIITYLRNEKQWSRSRVLSAFYEIKSLLDTAKTA